MGYLYIKHDDSSGSSDSGQSTSAQNSNNKIEKHSEYKIARQKIDQRVQKHNEYKDYKKIQMINNIKAIKTKYQDINRSTAVRAANIIVSGNYEGYKKANDWIKDTILK